MQLQKGAKLTHGLPRYLMHEAAARGQVIHGTARMSAFQVCIVTAIIRN